MHLLMPTVLSCWIILFPYKSCAVRDRREPHLEVLTTCPKEYSQDTNHLEEGSQMYFRSGESENVKCDGFGQSWGFEHNNFDSRFMIYPHSVRQCKSNGVWSSPIPICIFKHTNSKFNTSLQKAKVQPYHVMPVGSVNTSYPSKEEWQPIGQKRCSSSTEQSNMQIRNDVLKNYDLVYSFHRPRFFSFTILYYSADVIDVQLFAKKHGILKNISQEAKTFLQDHYKRWRMLHPVESLDKECPIINMPVYTDEIRVRYSVVLRKTELDETVPLQLASKDMADHAANISFYRIVKCYESEEEDHRQTCPEPPKILNSEVLIKTSNMTSFHCHKGYTMVDPITNRNVSGLITCIEGDWFPYPFPVCKRIIKSYHRPMRFSTTINQLFSESLPQEKNEITKAPTTPTKPQKVSAKSDVIFTVAILCLLILGFISSSASMILYVKWRRQVSKMRREETSLGVVLEDDRFMHPTYCRSEILVNCDSQFGIDVPSWQQESDLSEFSFETTNDYDYPSCE